MRDAQALKKQLKDCFSPLFLILLAFFLLAPFACGFLFTPWEEPKKTAPEEERQLLMAAKKEAQEAENDEEAAFLDAALRLSLSVWEKEFDFLGASLYASLEKAGEQEAKDRLEAILTERDEAALLAFYGEWLEKEGMEQEKIREDLFATSLRMYATADGVTTPGESLAISHLRTLKDSLASEQNRFHLIKKNEPLSSDDREKFESLSALFSRLLQEERIDPVPANGEALTLLESLLSFFLLLASVFLFLREKEAPLSLPLLRLALLTAVCALALLLSCGLFSPATLSPVPFLVGKNYAALPGGCALFLRMALRSWENAFPLLLFFLICQGKEKKGRYAFTVFGGFFLYRILSFFLLLLNPKQYSSLLLPFIHADSVQNLIPSLPLSLPQSESPLLSLLLLSAANGLLLFFLFKKKKRS